MDENLIKESELIIFNIRGHLSNYNLTWNIIQMSKDKIIFGIHVIDSWAIGLYDEKEVIEIYFHKQLIRSQKHAN